MADEQAEMGCAFAEEPAFPGQKRLSTPPWLGIHVDPEKTGHQLSRDWAPNKALIKSIIAVKLCE